MQLASSSLTLPLLDVGTPYQKVRNSGKNKNMAMVPTGPETKIALARASTNLKLYSVA
jgi:hypothetical protein